MKRVVFLVLSAACLASCGQRNAPKSDISAEANTPVDSIIAAEKLVMVALDPTGAATHHSHIAGLEDKVVFQFNALAGQNLSADISQTDTIPANIRINQIISPSGAADGPFGIQAEYPLTETGTWQIIVAESLMNGEPYTGPFTLTFQLK